MKNHYFFTLVVLAILNTSCRGPQGPAGPPGSGGIETLVDPAIMPRVMYTYPPANSVGPYTDFYYPRITIRFNKIMRLGDLRSAISMSSPLGDVRVDTNQIYSLGGDIFYVYPVDSTRYSFIRWRIAQTYRLDISSVARDINGNYLQPSFSMAMIPQPHFRVRFVNPQDGAQDVRTYSSLYLYFNSPVDTTIFSSIQITPPLQGQWRFMDYYFPPDSSTLNFSYSGSAGLSNNTTYTITVGTTARDKYGNQIPQQFTSTFTTTQFRVDHAYPANGSINVNLNNSIYVFFTGPIDTGTVRSAFSISPAITGTFSMYDGSSYFYYNPTNGLVASTMYSVTISTALRAKNGTSLEAPYTFSFTTAPFQVTSTYPYNGQTNVSRNTSISALCNAPLDTASVRSAFSVTPDVVGTLYLYDPSSSFYFYPSSTLAANQTYNVTINTGLRSKSGSTLVSPYTFSFTTGN